MANTNPRAVTLSPEMQETLNSIRRIDEGGTLYECDCLWQYDSPLGQQLLKKYELAAGCSVFVTDCTEGGVLTCRSYDYPHHVKNQAEAPATGCNVVVHTAPQGKYRSVGVADAFWLDPDTIYAGTLDDGTTDITAAVMLPYIIMDGMNEKGLTVSIQSQPIKTGETGVKMDETGKPKLTHTVFMRKLLDECDTVENAIAMAKSINMVSPNGADYRIFVTDALGKGVAFEWRYNHLWVTRTNIATNFYVGFDDAEPRYADGILKENVTKIENATLPYKYGYGGGYQRFACILAQLERFVDRQEPEYVTKMSFSRAAATIKAAGQGLGSEPTSYTQYAAVYYSRDLSLTLYVRPEFDVAYSFKVINE